VIKLRGFIRYFESFKPSFPRQSEDNLAVYSRLKVQVANPRTSSCTVDRYLTICATEMVTWAMWGRSCTVVQRKCWMALK